MTTPRTRARSPLIEALEPRVLLSASTAGNAALSTAVKNDHLQINIDLLKFRIDAFSLDVTLLADVIAVKNNDPKAATTIKPLIKQMKNDINTMHTTLKQDRLTESAATLSDEVVIVKELLQISKDRGNPTAIAADRQLLLADRIQLQTDMVAGLNARIATRQNSYPAIVADGQAVITAAQTDPNATPALTAAISKWSTDRTAKIATLTTDLQTLVADRSQLITDLTAMQNT